MAAGGAGGAGGERRAFICSSFAWRELQHLSGVLLSMNRYSCAYIMRKERGYGVRKHLALLLALFMLWPVSAGLAGASPEAGHVVILPVHGDVEPGLAAFVTRALNRAAADNARAVLLEVRTLGGRVDAALDMRDAILESPVPVHAFITGRAWSAGALISLAAEQIIMAPGSSIGSAEPRPLNAKTLSAIRSEMQSTAEARGRDPKIAAAMCDASIEIPDLTAKGSILNLTAARAVEVGYALGLASDRHAALEKLGLGASSVVVASPTFSEQFSRFVTNPTVTPILLTIGVLGLLVEAVVPGFGVPGIIGLTSLALLILGRTMAELAGVESALLFLLGLALLTIEAFMPGFGVFGVSGIALLVVALVLIMRTAESAWAVGISLVVAVLIITAMLRYAQKKGFWSRLSLKSTLEEARASDAPKVSVGDQGIALTPLRPSGTVQFGPSRVSVVTDGAYVAPGTKVVVDSVAGNRIVVRRLEKE